MRGPVSTTRNLNSSFLISLGENQLVLFRSSQAIDLPVIFDPDFVSTSSQRVELDDLGKHRGRLICLLVLGFLVAAAHNENTRKVPVWAWDVLCPKGSRLKSLLRSNLN